MRPIDPIRPVSFERGQSTARGMAKWNAVRLPDGRLALKTARENQISRAAFENRLKKGWKLEDACMLPIGGSSPRRLRPDDSY